MLRNTAGQSLTVYAWDATTGLPKPGDAANIAAFVSIDDGAVAQLVDTTAAEVSATNAPGYYTFGLAQAETNGGKLMFPAKSSTTSIVALAVPPVVYTEAPLTLGAGTVQAGATTTSIVLSGSSLGTTSGLYTGRRLYVELAAGGYLLTGTCTHTYSGGLHTFAFATANTATPAANDTAEVVGI